MTEPSVGLLCTTGTTAFGTTGTACHTMPAVCTFPGWHRSDTSRRTP